MADLRAFILTTRAAYLNLSRNGSTGLGSSSHFSRRSDSIPKANDGGASGFHGTTMTSSKVLQDLLETVSSLTSLSDKDRDSIDLQAKVMMRQIKGAIEELESLEQERRKRQQKHSSVTGLNQLLAAATMGSTGPVDNLAQHRQGVTLYLNERLASLATLHKDQYETRLAREMEKRESSLYKALPKPNSTGSSLSQRRHLGRKGDDLSANSRPFTPPLPSAAQSSSTLATAPTTARTAGAGASAAGTIGSSRVDPATGISSSQYYHQQQHPNHHQTSGFVVDDDDGQDFEQSLSAQQRQMLELENETIVKKLETELNQVRQLESSMLELSSLHSTIQDHLEVQTLQTNRLHEEALTAISHIDAGNDQLIKAGKRNSSTRKWILFFLILASFVLLFLDWYD
ncbi:hypothetical protein BGZ70_003403 [Mortierella alpina]|uniref:t-SNARE coiled-coil homology domain-containing protein n=1 Tax=Mortierella alpina TaxID=64518 RepID=A0A9P6JAD9_MORAP|nr:hypothetical protein BGZ70_003403 [Mortierella alpina]